jgi:hypothetical protein
VGVDSLTARCTRFLFFAEDALDVPKKSIDVPDSCLPHIVVHICSPAQRLQSLVIMASRAHYAPSLLSLLATTVSRTLRQLRIWISPTFMHHLHHLAPLSSLEELTIALRISGYFELKAEPIQTPSPPTLPCIPARMRTLCIDSYWSNQEDLTGQILANSFASCTLSRLVHLILCMGQDPDTKSAEVLCDFFARHAHTSRVELQVNQTSFWMPILSSIRAPRLGVVHWFPPEFVTWLPTSMDALELRVCFDDTFTGRDDPNPRFQESHAFLDELVMRGSTSRNLGRLVLSLDESSMTADDPVTQNSPAAFVAAHTIESKCHAQLHQTPHGSR